MPTIERMISQLICVEVNLQEINNNPQKSEELKKQIREFQWGGVILFEGEIESSSKLIDELQKTSEIPLFVCSDLERGAGQHFRGATYFPSNMAIGATGELDHAFRAGKITAQEAKEIGINAIFAPIVDVNNNPQNPIINIRSYGGNPRMVGDMAEAFIRGCQAEGVMATAKHFPGHGDTSDDSHMKLPVIKKTVKELEKTELYPFKRAVKSDVGAIMSAHIAVPSLDESMTPATLSKRIMTDLLRVKLGFEGIVFTDALIMDGVKKEYLKSQAVKAVLAGCDILLMPPSPVDAFNQVKKAFEEKIIPFEVIESSYNRILKKKSIFCSLDYKRNLNRINSTKNKSFAKLLAQDSVTKVRGSAKLPVNYSGKDIINILIDQDDKPGIWKNYSLKLKEKYNVSTFLIGSEVSDENIENIDKNLKDDALIIISFFSQIKECKDNIYPGKNVLKWLREIIANKKDTIVITFSNPYLINKIPGIKNYYCTYSDSPESQDAVMEVIFGGMHPKGISPVTL